MSELSCTGPLEDRHRELGASFAEFGGWLMPVSYAGTVSEHNATRNAVGLFDVSHLGKALVRGPGAAQFVNSALTNDLGRIGPGKAQYTLCCTESGGVVDDLIAYYVDDDEIFLVPNAANTAAVVEALQAAAPAGLTITNEHRSYAVLAVQGPRSADVLGELGLPTDMDYMGYADASYSGVPVRVCRTGYTGEHGYELLPPWDSARRGVRRAGRGGQRGRRRARRPGRPRHAAHRDGLSAARARTVARHLAAAGPLRLGDRLEEGRVLRPRRAAGREGGGTAAAAARAAHGRPRRAARRADGARRRHPGRASPRRGRSPRRCRSASGWR